MTALSERCLKAVIVQRMTGSANGLLIMSKWKNGMQCDAHGRGLANLFHAAATWLRDLMEFR
ncbi:hypothetical protein D3870_16685 [Noviherbaspirillum cavernae]|uniref:Uncharacterized protein n=1 Tax=Noviherbaspirillum cavernae TaxID=2320862 RepID=A0A418X4S4_9BURK|nr:hypothetical protein D3870_16685 [Noviherbaspirillum cavernae]